MSGFMFHSSQLSMEQAAKEFAPDDPRLVINYRKVGRGAAVETTCSLHSPLGFTQAHTVYALTLIQSTSSVQHRIPAPRPQPCNWWECSITCRCSYFAWTG